MLCCGFWPSGETGVGSIPTRHSGYMQPPIESKGILSEMSVGIKLKEKHMKKAGTKNDTNIQKSTRTLNLSFKLKFRTIVAAVVGICLLGAPSTRDHEQNKCEQMHSPERSIAVALLRR